MITITTPEQFTTSLWKNGKGKTTELTINPNGSIHQFSYRLSIASVVEDGVFSDFSGYTRNLILLTGEGITLTHEQQAAHHLVTPLAVATFDGGDITHGKLVNGAITDFNLMHDDTLYQARVITATTMQRHAISGRGLYFAYSPKSALQLTDKKTKQRTEIQKEHLLQIEQPGEQAYEVVGENIILIRLEAR